MTQTIEQLTARVRELEAENRIERNLRISVEATFDMLNEEIGRYKAAFEQQKEEIQRWKYSAENPNFEGRFDTWQSVAGKYRAEAEELEEENARLKVIEESALKVCGQLDEVVIALPYDYLDPPDGGDVSLGEQVKRMYSEVKTLRHAVVASQLHAEQLREALRRYGCKCAGCSCMVSKALALPRDTSALDAYVAEKVKEAMK